MANCAATAGHVLPCCVCCRGVLARRKAARDGQAPEYDWPISDHGRSGMLADLETRA